MAETDTETWLQSAEAQQKLAELQQLKVLTSKADKERPVQAAKNFVDFCEFVMRDEASNSVIKLQPIHLMWIKHMQLCWSRGLYCGILAPISHGKTTICGLALPLFALGHNSRIRIKYICDTDSHAKERLRFIRRMIEKSPEFQATFPDVRRDPELPWNAHELYLRRDTMAKDASLEAAGATSNITGSRSDLTILDDVNNFKNTIAQPRTRKTVSHNLKAGVISRLEPRCKALFIATRWHENDLVGEILGDRDMRQQWGFLIQRISRDMTSIECETIMGNGAKEYESDQNSLETLLGLLDDGVIGAQHLEEAPPI